MSVCYLDLSVVRIKLVLCAIFKFLFDRTRKWLEVMCDFENGLSIFSIIIVIWNSFFF